VVDRPRLLPVRLGGRVVALIVGDATKAIQRLGLAPAILARPIDLQGEFVGAAGRLELALLALNGAQTNQKLPQGVGLFLKPRLIVLKAQQALVIPLLGLLGLALGVGDNPQMAQRSHLANPAILLAIGFQGALHIGLGLDIVAGDLVVQPPLKGDLGQRNSGAAGECLQGGELVLAPPKQVQNLDLAFALLPAILQGERAGVVGQRRLVGVGPLGLAGRQIEIPQGQVALAAAAEVANLGVLYCDRGDIVRAAEQFRVGLLLAQAQDDRVLISYIHSHSAMLLLNQGDYVAAIDQAHTALALRRKLDLELWTTADLATLAGAHLALDQPTAAADYAQQALKLLDAHLNEALESPWRDYFVCAQVCRNVGDLESAKTALQTAYEQLQQHASKISDPALRQQFLERTPLYQEINAVLEALA